VDDQGSPSEEDTGNFVGMRCKNLTGHDTVEDQSSVGQGAWLSGHWLNGASISGVRLSKPWENRVVVGAISGSILILITEVANLPKINIEKPIFKSIP
jgi:hypothetical protein